MTTSGKTIKQFERINMFTFDLRRKHQGNVSITVAGQLHFLQ